MRSGATGPTRQRGDFGGVRQRARLAVGAFLGAVMGGAVPGCVADQDDSGPELVIELFWEDGSDGSRDDSETCGTAGVASVAWRLVLEDDGFDEVIAESEPGEACVNTLGFGDIPPGAYRLEMRGDDADGRTEWRGVCDALFVDRFDELYGCRVFLVDEAFTEQTMPAMSMTATGDAGTQDAGRMNAGTRGDAGASDAGTDGRAGRRGRME